MTLELTPADLPDALASMDTAPGITEAEIDALLAVAFKSVDWPRFKTLCAIRAFARAVASRTRQATPAPDEMAEAMEAFKELYTHCFCTPGPYEPPGYDLFARCLHVLSQPRASNAEALGTHQRTPEEFAIEFGEYMAKSAVSYMGMTQREWRDADVHSDRWNALNCAIYDFRKRAARTNAWLGEKPPLIESGASGPELGEEELREILAAELELFARPGAAEECRGGQGFHESIKAMREVARRVRDKKDSRA